MLLLLPAACSAEGDPDGGSPPDQAEAVGDENGPVNLIALGRELDADEVIDTRPGKPDRSPNLDYPGTVLQSRHLLTATSSQGDVDMFRVRIKELSEQQVVQDCMVIVVPGGNSMNCTEQLGDPLPGVGDSLLASVGSAGAGSFFELAGPVETSHFVVRLNDRVFVIRAIDGRAVATTDIQSPCPLTSARVQAWADDQLLQETGRPNWC